MAAMCWTGAGPPAGAAPGQDVERVMVLEPGPPRTVSGDGCNWPEYPMFTGGSTVTLTVTTFFAGGGRTSDPIVLADAVHPPTDAPGAWSWALPPVLLAETPPWATEVVLRAEGTCSWAIGGGFGYESLEARRAVDPSAPVATTSDARPAPQNGAAPASPVSGSPDFTG